MDTMPEDIKVWEFDAGSRDPEVRHQWRRNRNAAYRAAYKERTGKAHPASRSGQPKKDLDALIEQVKPPRGMTWNDFGSLWDLHHEHPFTPVLRRRSVDDEWEDQVAESTAAE